MGARPCKFALHCKTGGIYLLAPIFREILPLIVPRISHSLTTHRMLSPVLVELLLRLAGEAALGAGVGPLAAVVHLVPRLPDGNI